MSDQASKLREFWILEYEGPRAYDGDLILGEVLNPDSYQGNKPLIHVIEYSAFEAQAQQLASLQTLVTHYRTALEEIKANGKIGIPCPDGIANCAVNHYKFTGAGETAKQALADAPETGPSKDEK